MKQEMQAKKDELAWRVVVKPVWRGLRVQSLRCSITFNRLLLIDDAKRVAMRAFRSALSVDKRRCIPDADGGL
jgi:hypothetical protein